MIIQNDHSWYWPQLDAPGQCADVQVYTSPAERISALLGPDGEPLKVAYPRPKLGFDLTPRKGRT